MHVIDSNATEKKQVDARLLELLRELKPAIGHSPLRKLSFDAAHLYAKLESHNFSGSVKDWAAYYIVERAIEAGSITSDTVIVESSSGNFAIALAFICKKLKIDFIPVIDPNINAGYEKLLNLLCKRVVKVQEKDESGGYLLTRIKTVNEICSRLPRAFWPNQYDNEDNFKAYYYGLGVELAAELQRVDYLFVATSTCGTATGLSLRLKEAFPSIRVVAVDVEGSLIFSDKPEPRFVPGIGAGRVPSILKHAKIDEVIHVSHKDVLNGCKLLLDDQMLLSGASSGAVYFAIKQYFEGVTNAGHVLFVCPDHGAMYLDTVFDESWQRRTQEIINNHKEGK